MIKVKYYFNCWVENSLQIFVNHSFFSEFWLLVSRAEGNVYYHFVYLIEHQVKMFTITINLVFATNNSDFRNFLPQILSFKIAEWSKKKF